MKVGDQIHGFTVTSVEELAEQHARIWRMEHEKNKAQLIWMDNKEENRLFSIAFKTVPWDDSGVFHILEHLPQRHDLSGQDAVSGVEPQCEGLHEPGEGVSGCGVPAFHL